MNDEKAKSVDNNIRPRQSVMADHAAVGRCFFIISWIPHHGLGSAGT